MDIFSRDRIKEKKTKLEEGSAKPPKCIYILEKYNFENNTI